MVASKADRCPLPLNAPPTSRLCDCRTWKDDGVGLEISRPAGSYLKSLMYLLAKLGTPT